MASPHHYFHGAVALSVPLQRDLTQICQSTWGTTDASPLGIGLSRRRDGLMALSSRPGMPSFLENSRLSSVACSAFPPSEGNKLNKMQFTACPQVSSERGEVGGGGRPKASTSGCKSVCLCWLTPAVGLAPRFFCSHYPGAHIAGMQG